MKRRIASRRLRALAQREGRTESALLRELLGVTLRSAGDEVLDGEKIAVLCREFDISRKAGYKMYARYEDCGVEGLTDRSRRPYRHARQLPIQIEKAIVQLKQEHPSTRAT